MSMNNLKYKALALDLDGTLTDSNKNIPSKNKAAVQKAMDLGNGYCRPCKRVGV